MPRSPTLPALVGALLLLGACVVAAAINAVCVWLLARLREPDVNIRAANTFSWNDFAANRSKSIVWPHHRSFR